MGVPDVRPLLISIWLPLALVLLHHLPSLWLDGGAVSLA